jgi:ABC-type transport system involved in multi-copper enzyme maturation permease subunit
MILLPIVSRELRVASRRRGTYWWRTMAALTAIVLGTWIFLMIEFQQGPRQTAGFVIFSMVTGTTVLYALFNGVQATVDCLSAEKREGTLGLLFLTDLKGYDVVLGKLAAASLRVLYGVIAVVPMLAVPVMMGGVTFGEVGRMALVALNALFFSLTVGIFVSAMSRSARRAVEGAFGLLVLFTGALPACAGWLKYYHKPVWTQTACLAPSAGFAYYQAFDVQNKVTPGVFWISMGVIHALGWIFLALASVVAPRSWQDRPATARGLRWRERWQQWTFGNAEERRKYRARLLDANAFFWLASRSRLKPAGVWLLLCLLGCGWAWGAKKLGREWFDLPVYVMTGLLLNSLLKNWVAAEATRQLSEERSRGSLELLLSTPLSVREILHGQFLALQRQFLGPLALVIVLNFFFMNSISMRLLGSDWQANDDDRASWYCVWIAAIVMLMADLAAVYWLGMWQGLKARNSNAAIRVTQAWILLLPWVAMALVWLLVTMVAYLSGIRWDIFGWKFWLACWVFFGLATDIGFGIRARNKLLTGFRAAATERYVPHVKRLARKPPATGGAANPPAPPMIQAAGK